MSMALHVLHKNWVYLLCRGFLTIFRGYMYFENVITIEIFHPIVSLLPLTSHVLNGFHCNDFKRGQLRVFNQTQALILFMISPIMF